MAKGRGSYATKMCTYCGKPRQMVDVCYRKHGFSLNFKFWVPNGGGCEQCREKTKDGVEISGGKGTYGLIIQRHRLFKYNIMSFMHQNLYIVLILSLLIHRSSFFLFKKSGAFENIKNQLFGS